MDISVYPFLLFLTTYSNTNHDDDDDDDDGGDAFVPYT